MASLRDNLLAHWRLDEASGTRVDATGNGYDLTAVNGPGSTTGVIGNAAALSAASNQYLSYSTLVALPISGSYTAAGWAKDTGAPGTGTAFTLWDLNTTGGLALDVFRDEGTGVVGVYADTKGGFALPETAATIGTGAYFFWVAWYDAGADTYNVQFNDGTIASAAGGGGPLGTPDTILVGADPNGSLNGAIDSVSLWSRTLTSAERTALYGGGSGWDYPFTTPGPNHAVSGPTNSTTIRLGVTARPSLDYAANVDYAAAIDWNGGTQSFSDVVTVGTTTTGKQDYAETLDYAAAVDYAGLVTVAGYSTVVRQEG